MLPAAMSYDDRLLGRYSHHGGVNYASRHLHAQLYYHYKRDVLLGAR